MTKISKKLLVFLSVLVCTLCLSFGLAACNPSDNDNTNDDNNGHTHTFGGAWLYDGAEGHYQLATCHPEAKSALEDHFDNDEDGECDACGFDMSNEDGEHEHTYAEEWTFNENMHWHNATCGHFIERSDYDDHSFVEGVCECGVKESEVKVYELYKTSPEYELYFPQWLQWLKEHNVVSVEYTESGDGIYHYEDGHSEVRFLGERTVKVKAVKDGESLADVWFMVAMYQTAEEGYYESNGTIALGIAKTDSTGVAEIAFRPVGGYSSETIEYRIRIAERKDIAVFEDVAEAQASRPFPNRHSVKGGAQGFEYAPCEVSENTTSDDIAATIEFEYSAGWNAYNTIELPYKRYYEDLINGENIKETGKTYQFTSSGYNLFDYFVLTPAKYSLKDATTTEENDKIVANAKIAASGVYKISFTVDRNATAQLYYWNEQGVNLGAYHQTKADGTPSDVYLTDKSVENDYVTVKIGPGLGLRYFQLGIKTDIECTVILTVERIDDYGSGVAATFEWDDETQKSQVKLEDMSQGDTVMLGISGVSEGLYTVSAYPYSSSSSFLGKYYVWTDANEQSQCLWSPKDYTNREGFRTGVIRITEETQFIFINSPEDSRGPTFILEKYTLPTVQADEFAALPVSSVAASAHYEAPLQVSLDSYILNVAVSGKQNQVGGNDYPLSVYIGDTLYTLENPVAKSFSYGGMSTYTYTMENITIGEQDTTISIRCCTPELFTAAVQITAPHECKDVCPECHKCLTDCSKPECAEKCAGHEEPDVPVDGVIKDFGKLTLAAGAESSNLSLKDLAAKRYYIVAETESTPESGTISLTICGKSAVAISGDMYTPITNKYKCLIEVQEAWLTSSYCYIRLQNTSSEEIKITSLKIVAYEDYTIEAGNEYEVTAPISSLGFWYIPINEGFAGKKIRVTVTNYPATDKDVRVYYELSGSKSYKSLTNDNGYVMEFELPEGVTSLAFTQTNSGSFYNIAVKIDLA